MDTILILHGWGASSKSWHRVKELLESEEVKVLVPDLPGFGESVPLTYAWSISNYADWVNDFCEKNNLSQLFILGHSFGGSVAIKFSLKYPEKVKKLILVDSAGIRRKTFKKEISKKVAKLVKVFSFLPFYSFFRKVLYKLIFQSDYLTVKGVMKETYLKTLNENLLNDLALISVNTLLIWGEKDKFTPLRDAYLMKDKIAQASLETIPNIGHNPHSEAPEILVEKILTYLKL